MTFDVAVVGGGTAGCVLAARLSEDGERRVCLIEAGPDYGHRSEARWPGDLLDPRAFTFTHDWGTGGEDARSLGARVIGGCSVHNACMALAGSASDYDEWGAEWSFDRFAPYLDRARRMLRVAPANTPDPAPLHAAFLEAAAALGLPSLDDPDDLRQPVGVARLPANVVDGVRWSTALAYLDDARQRPNLTILARHARRSRRRSTESGRSPRSRRRASGSRPTPSSSRRAPTSRPRSCSGPASAPRRSSDGMRSAWSGPCRWARRFSTTTARGSAGAATDALDRETADHVARTGPLFLPHAFVKAASSVCAASSWDLHVLSWTNPTDEGTGYEASMGVFHLKPGSSGRVRLRSRDPTELPVVERGFLGDPSDLTTIVEGLELARALAAQEPLARLLGGEREPGAEDLSAYARRTVRNYFHPAGTCGIGRVVDASGRVLGVDGLVVADASVMPTIPRANTNLTTVAIAERLAETI